MHMAGVKLRLVVKKWYANAYGWRTTFHLWCASDEMAYRLRRLCTTQ